MKKSLVILGIAATICANTVIAATVPAKKTRSFTTQSWFSSSMEDVITIQNSINDYATRVFITVGSGDFNTATGLVSATGMNIKGCGNITHVDVGSSVLCELSSFNPVITLSADKSSKDAAAYGTYEVA